MATRSTTFDLFAPDGCRQAVLNSIRRYRAACRELYGVLLLGQQAGASIAEHANGIRVTPDNDRAKLILALALGAAKIKKGEKVRGQGQAYTVRTGSGLGYEMRDWFLQELYPGALSFVWDNARRDVTTVWTSADPEFSRAKRGWLALQGARGIAQFQRRGIGFPPATARPKLDGTTLTLKWDHNLGPVEFKILDKLNRGQSWIWTKLRDRAEGWELGTLYLTERDGKLFVMISYSRPAEAMALNETRTCRVTFGEGAAFITIHSPDGAVELVSDAAILDYLNRQRRRKVRLEEARAACGAKKKPWGDRPSWQAKQDVISRATQQREKVQKDYNHAWARRIVSRAVYWKCGRIELGEFPATLAHGHPWQWAQLKSFLAYKAQERGITLAE